MAYTLNPDGTIKADTLDELLLLKKRLAAQAAPSALSQSNAEPKTEPLARQFVRRISALSEPRPDLRAQLTEKLLTAIHAGGAGGVSSDDLFPVLGVTAPRGMGGKIGAINDFIAEHNLNPNEVYIRSRTSSGPVWQAGPKIHEILELAKGKAE